MEITVGTRMIQTDLAAAGGEKRRPCRVIEIMDDGRYVIESSNLYRDWFVVPSFFFEMMGYTVDPDQRTAAEKAGERPCYYSEFVGKCYYDVTDPTKQIVVISCYVEPSSSSRPWSVSPLYTVKYESGLPRAGRGHSITDKYGNQDNRFEFMRYGDLVGSGIEGHWHRWIEIEGADGNVSLDADHEGQLVLC